jgi:putative ABC transport system substrate-binding protein
MIVFARHVEVLGGDRMRRREFITLFGGAVATWPLHGHAQQPAMPVVGFLNGGSPGAFADRVRIFGQGLTEAGFVQGRNVAIEYRWAGGHNDLLAEMAADLVRRKVTVIAALGSAAPALAAKAATSTIPVVFQTGADPIETGLVATLNRPGGNLTGVTTLTSELVPKLFQQLHEVLPTAAVIAVLLNPNNPNAEPNTKNVQAAAHALGVKAHILHASNERDIEAAFSTIVQLRLRGLVILADPVFSGRVEQLASLTVRHAVPAIFLFREFAAAGGLMSYGGDFTESYRQVAAYVGRILRGEKPADLPIQQYSKIELVINLKTAKTLGLEVPTGLLVRADEVIE